VAGFTTKARRHQRAVLVLNTRRACFDTALTGLFSMNAIS
jgi:hypothetical protein